MSKKIVNNYKRNGINILGLLGLIFVTLKLIGIITWSWWWVTLPFWGVFAIAIIIIAFMFIFMFISLSIKYMVD